MFDEFKRQQNIHRKIWSTDITVQNRKRFFVNITKDLLIKGRGPGFIQFGFDSRIHPAGAIKNFALKMSIILFKQSYHPRYRDL
jgi:hypothetical protein